MSDFLKPIRSEAQYEAAMLKIDEFFDDLPVPGTGRGDDFEVLTLLVAKYEDERFPIREVDPVDLLHFAIDDMGHSQKELAGLLGSRSRASEVLNRKRPLTLEMIRTISDAWKLPVEVLTRPYQLMPEYA